MGAQIVCLWLDHEKFGCGWRDYIALEGRKRARLIMLSTGESAKLSMEKYMRALKYARPVARQTQAARRLRREAKLYGNSKSAAFIEPMAALRNAGAAIFTKKNRATGLIPMAAVPPHRLAQIVSALQQRVCRDRRG